MINIHAGVTLQPGNIESGKLRKNFIWLVGLSICLGTGQGREYGCQGGIGTEGERRYGHHEVWVPRSMGMGGRAIGTRRVLIRKGEGRREGGYRH